MYKFGDKTYYEVEQGEPVVQIILEKTALPILEEIQEIYLMLHPVTFIINSIILLNSIILFMLIHIVLRLIYSFY